VAVIQVPQPLKATPFRCKGQKGGEGHKFNSILGIKNNILMLHNAYIKTGKYISRYNLLIYFLLIQPTLLVSDISLLFFNKNVYQNIQRIHN
jgi:hypothetical protein